MKTYRILVHDHRQGEPIILTAELAHDRRAREFAHERLAASPDYWGVEVWDGTVRLCCLRSDKSDRAAA